MREPTQGIDYTSRDYTAYKDSMLKALQIRMPEYTDLSETDAGVVILEALAMGLDICSMYSDIIANDTMLPTTQDRRIATMLARPLGYVPKNQSASVVPVVFTLGEYLDEDTIIPEGTIVSVPETDDTDEIEFETETDLVIPAGKLGNEKDENDNYLYSVNAIHGSSVEDDVLGTSTGEPYQSFVLSYPEVLTDSISLFVDDGNGFEEWEQVPNFIDSKAESKHYLVMVDEFDNCYIEFGNGTNGKIPTQMDNGIVCSYRVGGGTIGNVQPNTITETDSEVPFIESVTNPSYPTILGHEKESIEEIRQNAPAIFRTQNRAVTAKDYSDLLIANFYEVLDAVGISSGLHMNLYYILKDGYSMTESLADDIEEFFSSRVIPGTSFSLHEYVESEVDLTVSLVVKDGYSAQTVESWVRDYIENTYFAYGELKFGDTIILSDFEYEVKSTFSGIRSIRVTSPSEDSISGDENEILTLGTLTINTRGGD